jgi:Flp pilus assembly protein CpaB
LSRRTRSVSLLAVSLICAGLAASLASGYERNVRAQVGPLVSVIVARKDLPRGTVITAADQQTYVERRKVPTRFVPPGALRSPSEALGLRTLTPVPAGGYLVETQLALPRAPAAEASSGAGRPRARVVEVPVSGASSLADAFRPGSRVDVLITSGEASTGGRTYLALQDVGLLAFRLDPDSSQSDGPDADALATLRVSLRQAVLLTAARNFARELRLLPRPPGDRARLRASVVRERDLRP